MAGPDQKSAYELLLSGLPKEAITKSGRTYDPRLPVWDWVDGPFHLLIDFGALPANFAQFVYALKSTLMVYAKGYSPGTISALFWSFMHFARANPALPAVGATITPIEMGMYVASLRGTSSTWRVSGLNPLLQKWRALDLPGVDQACADYLRHLRKPGSVKGVAVRTRDPDQGPFTDSEFRAIFRAVTAAYEVGDIPLWVNVMVRLLAACGGRPSQLASLKICDFTPAYSSPERLIPAKIALPQIKKGRVHARSEFLEFDLSGRAAELLADHIKALIEDLGCTPDSALFPLSEVRLDGEEDTRRPVGDLFFNHPTGRGLSSFFVARIRNFAPTSDRTGFAPISIYPRRFRYTFGTRMAEEGSSKAVIADRLGHADLQNVDVYFEASPAIVENIDRAMAAGLAPIAQAFCGRTIGGEHQASQGGAPGSRIIDFRISADPLGSCGKGSGCGLAKPVACYTCFRFEPWVDGPHQESLDRLLAERDRCADERMAGVNDDAITAVREVIAECEQARQQRHGGMTA
ncbi:site-specific integrase [Roseateles sp. NT4]|uniref:site-specific integrase n=1 Tax=Roseateles sp. NT4 TaxID=3453715 RepID=UPI003EEAB902